jgi:hypothetical protein
VATQTAIARPRHVVQHAGLPGANPKKLGTNLCSNRTQPDTCAPQTAHSQSSGVLWDCKQPSEGHWNTPNKATHNFRPNTPSQSSFTDQLNVLHAHCRPPRPHTCQGCTTAKTHRALRSIKNGTAFLNTYHRREKGADTKSYSALPA